LIAEEIHQENLETSEIANIGSASISKQGSLDFLSDDLDQLLQKSV